MAGFFSPQLLDQIRSASDIIEVIGGYLPLKRAGANFVALCPFHKEKSPSFNVNPHRQIFHCFGCHKGGDVFTFIKEYENIPFVDAVRRLAERARIPLETVEQPGQKEARHVKETLLQIHEQITQRWQACLQNDAAGQLARDYLEKRGVSDEAMKLFRLGAAPEAWDDTVNWAKSKGYDLALVEQAGLILKKEETGRHYDRFRGRLMFPICDEQGRVIGFSGRILSGDEKTAKYVNSPETPLFTKGKVIYGLDKSKRALLDAQSAIICEGQLDLIACYMADAKNVVAPQGTALTGDHVRILKRYVEEAVLCFDSDTAGQNAAARSLDALLGSDLAVRVAVMPAPHDPDSFIKAFGGDAFQKLIEEAQDFFDYYLNQLCSANELSSDKGRLAVLRQMAEAVHKTRNQVLVDKYAQKTALRLGVTPDSIRQEFKKLSRPSSRPVAMAEYVDAEASAPAEEALPRPTAHEFWFLKLILLHDELADWLAGHLDLDWLVHPVVRQAASARLQAHADHSWHGPAGLLDNLDDAAARSLVTEALAEDRPIPNPEQQIKDLLLRFRNQFLDRELAALAQRISQLEPGANEQLELMRRMHDLRTAKRLPLQPLSDSGIEPF